MLKIFSSLCRQRTSHYLIQNISRRSRTRYVSYDAKSFVPNENGPNIQLVRWLTKEMENEGIPNVENGPYKARAFQHAFKALDALPQAITSGEEALKVVGVGKGIARRIDVYLSQGAEGSSPKPAAPPKKTPEDIERERTLLEFRRVPGIGQVKAKRLYDAGCRSLDDLRNPEHFKSLSAPIRAALDYVDHLSERVTRAEIETVTNIIGPLISSETRMHAVGSYRRGLPSCGDVDIIFFHPSCTYVPRPGEKTMSCDSSSASSTTPATKRRGRPAKHVTPSQVKQDTLLRELVLRPLERAGLLAATLTEGSRKWQGIVRIPLETATSQPASGNGRANCIYRRMDLSLYPTLSEGAALLATTGDADFNAHVRRCASKQGLLLNEFGLWKFCPQSSPETETENTSSSKNSENVTGSNSDAEGRWELVASSTEKEILDELGVEYVGPERRNFTFVVSKSKQGSMLKLQRAVVKARKAKLK
ncbi:Nucleotidyltransferase [Fomitiporia mediterranea MF3/22]|uniref:Nucleotidyltransferase n=1 Tax=Fomitiporia mediterranea (strain MF3/22) TaxID=694068 RepID=UPI0004409A6B|nr:Nucleotidyltransferase [Fomitiporia mediterranea MF3/22]EJC98074.1 Nucleotidyltransferase [Fomitiporia mediterranea MF3/22]